MYLYDPIDQRIVDERVAQYRDQTERYPGGPAHRRRISTAPAAKRACTSSGMPRCCASPIPYGLLSSRQLRKLAHIARTYDRGYGHFSTRQNIQFNWPRLEQVPDILAELATVQMHAIQTSGNCIRNITTDHFAGIAPDEVVDPVVWAELLRQWSGLHPGIRLSAAQVQDRSQRLAGRSRRFVGSRHRPAPRCERRTARSAFG